MSESKCGWRARGEAFIEERLKPAIRAAGMDWVEPTLSDPEADGCWSADWTGPRGHGILGGGDDGEGGYFFIHSTRDSASSPPIAHSVEEFVGLYRSWLSRQPKEEQ